MKLRHRKWLLGPGIRIPPLSPVGCGHATHGQHRIVRQVEVVEKSADADTSGLDGINNRISNHRRIALIGRLVPYAGLGERTESVAKIERSAKLPLPVLRVDVVVEVEIELLGVERDLWSDEEMGRGRERMVVFRGQPV